MNDNLTNDQLTDDQHSGDTTSDWRHHAACRDEDPELFFPVSEIGPGARQVAEAKAVCARCPVRARCLDHAIGNRLTDGIFGGTTETERRAITRRVAA